MEAVPNGGATIACDYESQTTAVCSSHTLENLVRQPFSPKEDLILQVVCIFILEK